jgi:hypothetical protein
MTRAETLALIPTEDFGDGEPVTIPSAGLQHIIAADIPPGVLLSVGDTENGVVHIPWDGHFYVEGGELRASYRYLWTRKYWEAPLGMAFYLDLVRRAIEARQRIQGDVKFLSWEDDDAYIHVEFELLSLPSPLSHANDEVISRVARFEEGAAQVSQEIGKLAAEMARKISGWGEEEIETLVNAVDHGGSNDNKGRALEELVARIFAKVPGFSVTGRVRTETEEIDISILNNSDDALLKREEAFVLVECKNWSGVCGKNEFVIFKEKIENRKNRCSLGFLVSWNGFASTITKEMLRGSHDRVLIVPITGERLRSAVRSTDYIGMVLSAVGEAVHL